MNDKERAELIFHIIQKFDGIVFVSHFIITAFTVFDLMQDTFLATNPKATREFIKKALHIFK